jgi:hypothetical protein
MYENGKVLTGLSDAVTMRSAKNGEYYRRYFFRYFVFLGGGSTPPKEGRRSAALYHIQPHVHILSLQADWSAFSFRYSCAYRMVVCDGKLFGYPLPPFSDWRICM